MALFPAGGLSVEEIKKPTLTTLGLAFACIVSIDQGIDLMRRGSKACRRITPVLVVNEGAAPV